MKTVSIKFKDGEMRRIEEYCAEQKVTRHSFLKKTILAALPSKPKLSEADLIALEQYHEKKAEQQIEEDGFVEDYDFGA